MLRPLSSCAVGKKEREKQERERGRGGGTVSCDKNSYLMRRTSVIHACLNHHDCGIPNSYTLRINIHYSFMTIAVLIFIHTHCGIYIHP